MSNHSKASIFDNLRKRYGDRQYRYTQIIHHKGTVVAFAQDDSRKIHYAVLNFANASPDAVFDTQSWSDQPTPLTFPNEVTQVGYSVIPNLVIPAVKKNTRLEARDVQLTASQCDPFLSTTARFTTDTQFKVLSDNKYIFLFRQCISSDHEDNLFKLSNGQCSASDTPVAEYTLDKDGAKVPVAADNLLCDRFVLAGSNLHHVREPRFRRSRHKTQPDSANDSIGTTDMEGNPFFEPTQELAFVSNLKDGCFDLVQLPTIVSGIRRWQLFTHNFVSKRLDCFNVEVAKDGLFNLVGTQLYTSPDQTYAKSVLERQPGTCPFTSRQLVRIVEKTGHAETALSFPTAGGYATATSSAWETTEFTVEMWIRPSSTNMADGALLFSSQKNESENMFKIDCTSRGEYRFVHQNKSVIIGKAEEAWQHLAISYDGKELHFMLDHNAVSIEKVENLLVRFDETTIGNVNSGKSFCGSIDEIRVWDCFRMSLEVSATCATRLVGNELGLRHYYRLDEGRGRTAHDQCDTGNHLSLSDNLTWISSDCPIGDNKGIRRNSFSIDGRSITGGLSAKLYYQQENFATGYDGGAKSMKKQARVMLVIGSVTNGSEDTPMIASVDLPVSREGRLAQIPEVLNLPLIKTPQEATDLNIIEELQNDIEINAKKIASTRSEISKLSAELTKAPDSKDEKELLKKEIQTLQQQIAIEKGRFTNYWCEIVLWNNQRLDFNSDKLFLRSNSSKEFRFTQVDGGFYKIQESSTNDYIHEEDGGRNVRWWNGDSNTASHWRMQWKNNSFSLQNRRYQNFGYFYPNYYGFYSSNSIAYTSYMKPKLTRYCNNVVSDLEKKLISSQDKLSTLEAEISQLEQTSDLIASKTEELNNLVAKNEELKEQLANEEDGGSLGITLKMGLIYSDSSGLHVRGGILEFATIESMPFLHDSATGKLVMYYTDKTSSSQLMSAHFDTNVSKTRFVASPELSFVSRATGKSSVDEIVVSAGPTKETCMIVITENAQGITETWKNVPRIPSELSKAINGTEPRGTDVVCVIHPPMYDVSERSSLIRAVFAESSHNPDAPIKDRKLPKQIGKDSHWIADSPGKSFLFGAKTQLLQLPKEALINTAAKDELTVECWVKPSVEISDTAYIVNHVSKDSAYRIGVKLIDESRDDTEFKVVAGVSQGTEESHSGATYVESIESIKASSWTHLSMQFKPSYGMSLGADQFIDCGKSPTLDISGDLTIEMYVKLNNSGSAHGLIGKGHLGNATSGVPYQLQVDAKGQIELIFQALGKRKVSYKSKKAISFGKFHRIAVVRRAVESRHDERSQEMITYLNEEGKERQTYFDVVKSISFEELNEIQFFIDGEQAGTSWYKGPSPDGYDGAMEIGRCYVSSDEILHMDGVIAEVRVWNTVVADGSLCTKLNGDEQGLMGYWDMEDREGNIASDTKGTSHGRIRNGNWVKSPDPAASSLVLFKNGDVMTHVLTTPDAAKNDMEWGDDCFSLGGSLMKDVRAYTFSGLLEEVRVWRTVRTPEQLLDNIFTRIKGEKQDLLAYYTFDYASCENGADKLMDNGLRGNDLPLSSDEKVRPIPMLSAAPVSQETAIIRPALTSIKTDFHEMGDVPTAAVEYADMQRDSNGNLEGILKRCYSHINSGEWQLTTGYKVGALVTEWMGQAQFDPQVIGYVEGAPPVPSENLIKGLIPSADGMGTIDIVESEQVSQTVGVEKEGSCDLAFAASASLSGGSDDLLITAPLGIGAAKQITEIDLDVGAQGSMDISNGWSQAESLGTGVNRTQTISVSTGGQFESPESEHQLNPSIGCRALTSNTGFALVQSATADIFALRLQHNNALVSYRMIPNSNIPRDWNIIPFPINPKYTKQGTLDGYVGYDDDGRFVLDPDYEYRKSQGEYSYYKPREAYAMERTIRREEQRMFAYYQDYQTGFGSMMSGVAGSAAGAAASLLIPGVGAGLAAASIQSGVDSISKTFESPNVDKAYSKRDMVNTYVWTADGGLFSETTETTDVRTEISAGGFSFSGAVGGTFSADIEVFSIGVDLEFEASIGGGMSVTKTKTKEAEKTFSLDVGVDVPGYLQKHERNPDGFFVPVYDEDGNGVNVPGKVDAYRFKTFYLDATSDNFEDLFGKVIDPQWLAESDHPNAIAMRQVNQATRKPPCWRVFHRVTFVSRLLPEFQDNVEAPPLDKAMRAQNIESNWQLIRKLEPFVKSKIADSAAFKSAVKKTLEKYLPELVPHQKEILYYLRLYYGVTN